MLFQLPTPNFQLPKRSVRESGMNIGPLRQLVTFSPRRFVLSALGVGSWRLGVVLISGCATLLGAAPPQNRAQETYPQKTRTFHSADEFARMTSGKVRVVKEQKGQLPADLPVQLPVRPVTILAESASARWLGTAQGAIRVDRGSGSYAYFAG